MENIVYVIYIRHSLGVSQNTNTWKMSRGPIDMATGYSTSGGVLHRERYDSLPTTSPWDNSLPIGAEYPRHVHGVAPELPFDDETNPMNIPMNIGTVREVLEYQIGNSKCSGRDQGRMIECTSLLYKTVCYT